MSFFKKPGVPKFIVDDLARRFFVGRVGILDVDSPEARSDIGVVAVDFVVGFEYRCAELRGDDDKLMIERDDSRWFLAPIDFVVSEVEIDVF